MKARTLAVIPARSGSKGLPGKNTRDFAGLPLIAHSILCARACPSVSRVVVSTDSPRIAAAARRYGADVPFSRPAALAGDKTPLWPVLRHALAAVEAEEGRPYDFLLLLDPTSPTRLPADIAAALAKLARSPRADGVVAVAEPDYHPLWHSVSEERGWMKDLSASGARWSSRQEAPRLLRITGLLYAWRTAFVRRTTGAWREEGRHLLYEMDELRSCSIDTRAQFDKMEALVRAGLVRLPWLGKRKG